MEEQGEIRGGHFVNGVSGEQFAMPEAIGLLRSLRKTEPTDEVIVINAADPLNLFGILTSGPRIPAITANRILWQGGRPLAALVGGDIQPLDAAVDVESAWLRQALVVGTLAPELRPYYG
jgi:ATP-dependent Lhr-like helicase